MEDLSFNISIMTLNVNGLNMTTERERLAEWIKNHVHLYAVYKNKLSFVVGTLFQYNNTEVERERMEKAIL